MRTITMRAKAMKLALAVVTGALLLTAGSVWSADKPEYGDITLKQGYPLAKDIDTIKSNLQLNRATELFLWALPMNVAYATRDGILDASGGRYLDVVYTGGFVGADKIIPPQSLFDKSWKLNDLKKEK